MSSNISSLVKFSATGISLWRTASVAVTANPGDLILCDTTAGPFTVTLPSLPTMGTFVVLQDPSSSWGTNALIVNAGSQILLGSTGAKNFANAGVTLIFMGSSEGWKSFDAIGEFGAAVLAASNAASLATALGTAAMAYQSPSSVDITGGSIDGVSIGANSPASGSFSALTAATQSVMDISNNVATTSFARSLIRGNWRTFDTSVALAATDYPGNFFADTSGGSITITLPLSPADGAQIVVADYSNTWNVNNLIINPNGANIAGAASNLVCDINGYILTVLYMQSYGWRVYGASAQ